MVVKISHRYAVRNDKTTFVVIRQQQLTQMSQLAYPRPPLAFLACQVFQGWLERFLPANAQDRVTFFDYGLHSVPKKLRQTLQAQLDSIEEPSLVLLGYGLCGNGLDNIHAGKHTLLIPRSDDCIAIILGSYQAYREQTTQEPGTYYLCKGWLESGSNPLDESRALEVKYGPQTAAWLMDTQYQHYRRLVLVGRDEVELSEMRPKAQEIAAYCVRWGMRYEEKIGSDDFLSRLVAIANAPGQPALDEDFLLIPPGGTLKQSLFLR